jgi:hypothetical protein
MPVTARLSKAFYEKMGEQVTSELVEWFNSVDATYRSELRETNELNFARFDAKVGERFAEQDARIERRFAEMEVGMERRLAELIKALDEKFDRKMTEHFRWIMGTVIALYGLTATLLLRR